MTKVGDTLHHKATFGPWRSHKIEGETRGLWLLDNGHKVNKVGMITAADRQGYKTRYFTDAGREAEEFADAHARNLASAVSVCKDPVKLRAIAAILGIAIP